VGAASDRCAFIKGKALNRRAESSPIAPARVPFNHPVTK
jgi:hypothetical protein